MHRLIRHPHVKRIGVGIRINRNRPHPEPPRRADHPARDLAAIGDEESLEHRSDHILNTPNSGGGADAALFAKLGLKPLEAQEPMRAAAE
jgi:hypothetical protein